MKIQNNRTEANKMNAALALPVFAALSLFSVPLASDAAVPEESLPRIQFEREEGQLRAAENRPGDPFVQQERVVVQNQRPKPQGGQNQPGPGPGGPGGGGGGGYGVSGGRQVGDRLQAIVQRGPGGGGKALVVRSSESDPKQQGETEEDLAVMSHILDKAAAESAGREPFSRKIMGIDVYFTPGAGSLRSLFLEGYGALFFVKVNFPLLAPPEKPTPPKEDQPVDSSWGEAKRELYGRKPEGQLEPGPGEPFNADNVKKLKDALLEALKNGANIRHLKADDSITLCVFGGSGRGGGLWKGNVHKQTMIKRESGKDEPEVIVHEEQDGPPGGRGTIMTIRVRKSDIDAFAKGKLNLDEFRKNARITTYAGDLGGEGFMPFGFREWGSGSGSSSWSR